MNLSELRQIAETAIDPDERYVAAFDPSTVLALLDVAEAAESRNEHDVMDALDRLREVAG